MKTIHINGKVWKYNIGRKFVNIISPADPKVGHGKRTNVEIPTLKGTTWFKINEARWCYCGDPCNCWLEPEFNPHGIKQEDAFVRPQDIRKYILENLV